MYTIFAQFLSSLSPPTGHNRLAVKYLWVSHFTYILDVLWRRQWPQCIRPIFASHREQMWYEREMSQQEPTLLERYWFSPNNIYSVGHRSFPFKRRVKQVGFRHHWTAAGNSTEGWISCDTASLFLNEFPFVCVARQPHLRSNTLTWGKDIYPSTTYKKGGFPYTNYGNRKWLDRTHTCLFI